MSLKYLTSDDLESYHEQGMLIIEDLFSEAECDEINAEIDRLIIAEAQQQGVQPHQGMWLLQLGLRSDLTRRIASDERFLSVIEDIVQPGIAIYSAKLVPKAPYSEELCTWHQDDSYYRDNSESSVRMSVWLALQDSYEENGAVHFIPGSHHDGQQEWFEREGVACSREILHKDPQKIKQAICPSIKKGSVVLFDSLLWHRSGPNKTEHLRRSFIVSYQDALAQGGNGEQWQILRKAFCI